MRMLIALIVFILYCFDYSSSSHPPDQSLFLIFSNDGTFYKMDAKQEIVHWHSNLGEKLISFQLSQEEAQFQNQLSTYFIPTIQGHFVYIDKNKQILVHRQEIQPLLKICFGKSSQSQDLVLASQEQYFLHEKYEYFFIDLHNGKLWNIQNFFQEKIIAKESRHALIKISKKFLKQLKPNLQVKWSAISSTINIISAIQFLKDPKKIIQTQEVEDQKYEFRRISNNQLQIIQIQTGKSFQMGSTTPIMSVISYEKNGGSFKKYPILFYKKPILALQDKHQSHIDKQKNQISQAQTDIFPHSNQFKNSNRSNRKFQNVQQKNQFDFQYCVNTFRALQQLNTDTHISTNIPFIKQKEQYEINFGRQKYNSSQRKYYLPPTQQISPVSHPHLFYEPQRSKQQPLIWIFIIGSLIAAGGIFYKLKVGKLLVELQKLQTYHDKRFQEIQKKLGQFQQMQKMYEVYWDKLLYRKPRRKSSQVLEVQQVQNQELKDNKIKPNEIQIYQHMVFEGRFLNKEALVYAVPIQGIDLIHIEHQLNDLLSCSHKSLVKLYYYTKNTQFLLIFCEKIQPQWKSIQAESFFIRYKQQKILKSIQNIVSQKNILNQNQSLLKVDQKQKQSKQKKLSAEQLNKKLSLLVKQIIQCIDYLDSKIQIFSLPLEGIILNQRSVMSYEKDLDKSFTANLQIELKINTIPSILQVYKHDQDYSQEAKLKSKHIMSLKLRHDLVRLFYTVNTKGQKANIKSIYTMISKQQNTDGEEFFVRDFYDFVLNQNYNLNIQIDSGQKIQNKEEEKKTRVFGSHHQFLVNLLCHPFLWDSKRKMLFLSDFSNYVETYLDDFKLKKLESYAKDYQIIDTPWTKHLDIAFVREVNQFRKYDYNSVRDLIRLIRNKVNHFHEIPKQTRNAIGKTPQAFTQYMLKLYPKLLSFAFVYAKKKKWKLHVQME